MIDTIAIRRKLIDLALSGQLSIHNEFEKVKFEHKILTKYVEISDEEKEYVIPENWKYVRIEEIATINPKNILEDSLEVSFVPMACVQDGFSNRHTSEIRRWGDIKKGFAHFAEGDIGVAKITPCFQNRKSVVFTNLKNGFGAGTTELTIVRANKEYVVAEFLLYFFQSSLFISKGIESFTGVVGQQRIHKDYLKMSPIPLPPVEEQQRIVEKLDNVFLILDTIDELQASYNSDFEVLRNKLIDAGIQGKLTEQLPEDGNAEALYKDIQREKDKLIAEKKIPKEKKLPDIKDEEIPFEIPKSWKWVKVQDVASYITDYVANGSFATLKANTKTYKEPNYALFVRTMDLSAGFKEQCSYIDKESYEFLEKSKLFGGELILPNIGASIGKAFVMPDMKMPMSLAPNSIMLKFTHPIMNEYFSFVIKSTYGARLLEKTQGGSATAKFSKTELRTLIVPLPPLEEIVRIVNKINEVLALIK